MFTEYEIETVIDYPEILEATKQLKYDFLKSEAPYLEISEHDFFSLVMMTPNIGIAMADGKITLKEEMILNKKARKISKGGYFMRRDPVVDAMKYLIKQYDHWSDRFYQLLNLSMCVTCKINEFKPISLDDNTKLDYNSYKKVVLASPYMLIRYIASFFLEKDEDIINKKYKIDSREYERMIIVADKLGLKNVPVFQMFCRTFR